jgi:hypothetical protein
MSLKTELTKRVAEHHGLEDQQAQCRMAWWCDPRKLDYGFQLTSEGFEALTNAQIKSYPIKFDEEFFLSNQLNIWLNRHMPCPFFLTRKEIYVFSENMAIQLVLFNGNLERFIRAKINKLKD